MSALKPGAVVQATEQASSFRGHGVITGSRGWGEGHMLAVRWSDNAETENRAAQLELAGFHKTLKAGDSWNDYVIDEIDLTAEVMKVRVFEDKPGIWIDVRLFGMPRPMVRAAAEAREAWLEADRAKLDWFKPGQIVKNMQGVTGPLARPATVIEQTGPDRVMVITSNGTATVPAGQVFLAANSIQDLQAKEAQKREAVLENFRAEVLGKVLEAKEDHDLCDDGVGEFLESLGIKRPVRKVRAVLHLTVEVDAVIMQGTGMTRLDLDHNLNREWWANTLGFGDDGKDLNFKDDEDLDMDSVEVRLIASRVEEIHDESYIEGEQ